MTKLFDEMSDAELVSVAKKSGEPGNLNFNKRNDVINALVRRIQKLAKSPVEAPVMPVGVSKGSTKRQGRKPSQQS